MVGRQGRLVNGSTIAKGGKMSKSLARVIAALGGAGHPPLEMPSETRSAAQAAQAAGCALDQIVKSILFAGPSAKMYLFLTAGGHQVDVAIASTLAGEPLGRADPDDVRRVTGFAIGGVAPIGHLSPIPIWMDHKLMEFTTIWAAAGTPRHIFEISPAQLLDITGARLAQFTKAM
jgi:prolyl-tRNA editing enzyme YbaK/EbsC (Cys-tRNA(Pro) deacylase)